MKHVAVLWQDKAQHVFQNTGTVLKQTYLLGNLRHSLAVLLVPVRRLRRATPLALVDSAMVLQCHDAGLP